jgi:1,4-alpha-glucan branching enzyme
MSEQVLDSADTEEAPARATAGNAPPQPPTPRRFPIGAEVCSDGTHFRLWAPIRHKVAVVLEESGQSIELSPEGNGYFSGLVAGAGPGTRYHFWLDDDEHRYPDPASRFQPEGPDGPSQVRAPGQLQCASCQAWPVWA